MYLANKNISGLQNIPLFPESEPPKEIYPNFHQLEVIGLTKCS